VLARPGQVYAIRLRNHGPLRGVAEVRVDGRRVSAGGLVLDPGVTIDLERPIHATERGRFTVIAEGDETVFGPDGGRDNAQLGVIEVRFRRELPRSTWRELPPSLPAVPSPAPRPEPRPIPGAPTPGQPPMPEWTPPVGAPRALEARALRQRMAGGAAAFDEVVSASPAAPVRPGAPHIAPSAPAPAEEAIDRARLHEPGVGLPHGVERAAGTGLTGQSNQEFRAVHVGELESEATVLRLRLVVGDPDAIAAARPLPDPDAAPARPSARP
jgi:hypothetical protein